jgi:hypothetical protein
VPQCPSWTKEGVFRFEKLLLGTLKVIRNFVVQISVYFGTEEFLFVFGASFSIFRTILPILGGYEEFNDWFAFLCFLSVPIPVPLPPLSMSSGAQETQLKELLPCD